MTAAPSILSSLAFYRRFLAMLLSVAAMAAPALARA
jgi:hypothetical protein